MQILAASGITRTQKDFTKLPHLESSRLSGIAKTFVSSFVDSEGFL